MDYSFSCAIDGVNYLIQLKPNTVQQGVIINEMPHKHFFTELHYIFSGEEQLILPEKNQTLTLCQGQIALIPAGTYHGTESEPDKKVVRICFYLGIDTESRKNHPAQALLQNAKDVLITESSTIDSIMQRCRMVMEQETTSLSATQKGILLLEAVLELLQLGINEKAQALSREPEHTRQKWIIEEYLETGFHKNDGLEGLSRQLYLSQRQTRKLVYRFFGEDFRTLIIRRRMETAALLLQDPTKSLETIAAKVGYTSYSGFHLAFVRFFGCTPGQYRSNNHPK